MILARIIKQKALAQLLGVLGNKLPEEKLDFKLLRNDLLSDAADKEYYFKMYLNSYAVKKKLIALHDEIEEGKRKTFSPGLFVGEQGKINCAILSRFIIEEKLGWDFPDAVHRLTYRKLYKNHLRSAKQCFANLYELLMTAYPEKNLKPYYFKKYKNVWFDSRGRMKKETVAEAVHELIDTFTDPLGKYRYKIRDMPKWISYKLFQKKVLPYNTNLSYLLNKCFRNSPIDAIIFAYPELNLKPYYFRHVPKGYWSGKKGQKHAKELMDELLQKFTDANGPYKLSKEQVFEMMKYKTYHKPLLPYGKRLGGMLQALFSNSPSKPLMLVDSCSNLCDTCIKNNSGVCVYKESRLAEKA